MVMKTAANLKDKQWNDEASVANSWAGASSTLLRNNVRRTQQNDSKDHGIDDPDQRDTHHDPHRDEHNLYTSTTIITIIAL